MLKIGELHNMRNRLIRHVRGPAEIEALERGNLLELLDALVGQIGVEQRQVDQLRQLREVHYAAVGNVGARQIELLDRWQRGEDFEVRILGLTHVEVNPGHLSGGIASERAPEVLDLLDRRGRGFLVDLGRRFGLRGLRGWGRRRFRGSGRRRAGGFVGRRFLGIPGSATGHPGDRRRNQQ